MIEVARLWKSETDAHGLAQRVMLAGLCFHAHVVDVESPAASGSYWSVQVEEIVIPDAVAWFVRGFLGGIGDEGECMLSEQRR